MTKKPLAALLFALAFALGSAACSKHEEDETGEKAEKPATNGTDEGTAEPGGGTDEMGGGDEDSAKMGGAAGDTETLTLDKVDNLKITVPKGSTVGEAMGGEGAMIQGKDLVVTVEPASDTRPETTDAAKEAAGMYSPMKFEAESLDDGWVVTFENQGSMGTNYFVQARREIGGKAYWCETTASKPEQQANAVEACKSLTK